MPSPNAGRSNTIGQILFFSCNSLKEQVAVNLSAAYNSTKRVLVLFEAGTNPVSLQGHIGECPLHGRGAIRAGTAECAVNRA